MSRSYDIMVEEPGRAPKRAKKVEEPAPQDGQKPQETQKKPRKT